MGGSIWSSLPHVRHDHRVRLRRELAAVGGVQGTADGSDRCDCFFSSLLDKYACRGVWFADRPGSSQPYSPTGRLDNFRTVSRGVGLQDRDLEVGGLRSWVKTLISDGGVRHEHARGGLLAEFFSMSAGEVGWRLISRVNASSLGEAMV